MKIATSIMFGLLTIAYVSLKIGNIGDIRKKKKTEEKTRE